MLIGIFRADDDGKVIINEESIKLMPALRELPHEEVMFVSLVYDYVDSPYRFKPLEERIKLVSKKIWGVYDYSRNIKNIELFTKAVDEYKGLVFDIRRETIDRYKTKVNNLQKVLYDSNDQKEIKEVLMSIDMIEGKIDEYLVDIMREEEKEILTRGNKKMSYLEKWQRNQASYKEFKKSV